MDLKDMVETAYLMEGFLNATNEADKDIMLDTALNRKSSLLNWSLPPFALPADGDTTPSSRFLHGFDFSEAYSSPANPGMVKLLKAFLHKIENQMRHKWSPAQRRALYDDGLDAVQENLFKFLRAEFTGEAVLCPQFLIDDFKDAMHLPMSHFHSSPMYSPTSP